MPTSTYDEDDDGSCEEDDSISRGEDSPPVKSKGAKGAPPPDSGLGVRARARERRVYCDERATAEARDAQEARLASWRK